MGRPRRGDPPPEVRVRIRAQQISENQLRGEQPERDPALQGGQQGRGNYNVFNMIDLLLYSKKNKHYLILKRENIIYLRQHFLRQHYIKK